MRCAITCCILFSLSFVFGCGGGTKEMTFLDRMQMSDVLYANDFEHNEEGDYTLEFFYTDWNNPEYVSGAAGRTKIVRDSAGKVLQVMHPKGSYSENGGVVQWPLYFGKQEEIYASYKVKVPVDFDPVNGGKLPGLAGGIANTGGEVPTGYDGWTARMMWRKEAKVVLYLYYPDQGGDWGDDFPLEINDLPVFLTPGEWHHIEQRVVMNTPGVRDGIIQIWFDEVLALDMNDVLFRRTEDLQIDKLLFSNFFGGGSMQDAATKEEKINFKNFTVSSEKFGKF